MRIAIIGNGGREHALALKIAESSSLTKLFVIPGNPGTSQIAENINFDYNDHQKLISFCREQQIDLVVVGPEQPLTDGIANSLRDVGINAFGPSKNAARIEGEKSFAKELMKEYGIPTAAFEIFYKDDYEKAINYLQQSIYPTVIKADGIAAGKGVIIAQDFIEAKEAIDDCFLNSAFGSAGDKVVIEEFMSGQEASIFAITDGKEFVLLPAAQDHKRIFDGDKGKNTGGMGAYAPTPFVSESDLQFVSEKIIKPTLAALREKESEFIGCLYCGLMLTKNGPKVVEFNCRFGDPETQVVLPLLDGDFLALLNSAAIGKLDKDLIHVGERSAICIVIASRNYPDSSEKGIEIFGLENYPTNNSYVIHAGTKKEEEKILTNGGRVLGFVTKVDGNNLKLCKEKAYQEIVKINFSGMQFRKDIAQKALV